MTQENKDNNHSFINKAPNIAIVILTILMPVGFVLYIILKGGFGLDDFTSILIALILCIFIANKLIYGEKKPKISSIKDKKLNLHEKKLDNSECLYKEKRNTANNTEALTETKRSQKELDRYVNANHSKEDIGLFYERYIGYIFESKGWHVIYHGAKKGKEDEGIDLICIRNDRVRLLQCKYWSQNKTLFENSIFQLYGTWQFRVKRNDFAPKRLDAYLITSTVLSEFAKNSAETLDINIKQNFKLNKNYPKIKCTTTKEGEKIYHLPTDQQYDNIGINKDSRRFYVHTVADAVAQGHRRAYRHRFTN